MLLRIILVALLCSPLLSFSSSKVDSIINVLNVHPDSKDKLEIYRQLYRAYPNIESDTVLYYLLQENALAIQLGDKKAAGRSYFSIARFQKKKGDYDDAISNHLKAARIFQELEMHTYYGHSLNNLGLIAQLAGNYKSGIIFFSRAFTIFDLFEDDSNKIKTLWNLGLCYTNLEQYEFAKEKYNAALEIAQALNNDHWLYMSYNFLGELALKSCSYDTATIHYNRALLHISDPISEKAAVLKNNIGQAYLLQGEYAESEKHLLEALTLKQNIEDSENSIMITLSMLGQLKYQRGEFEKALAYLHEGIALGNDEILNKRLTNAITLLNKTNKALWQKNRIKIKVEESFNANEVLGNQHDKLYLLKNSLEANDIQNSLRYRIQIDKMNAQLLNVNWKVTYYIIVASLATVIAILLFILYFKTRALKEKVKSDLNNTNAHVRRAIDMLNPDKI